MIAFLVWCYRFAVAVILLPVAWSALVNGNLGGMCLVLVFILLAWVLAGSGPPGD